jgi:putative SOS response-associated peptidase YedK
MCNLYRMTRANAEIARLFSAPVDPGANFAAEVFPGYPGLVVAEGRVRVMNWGFPVRLKAMKPTSKPKPVTNARDDKLDTFFWRDSFERRRCLIPVSQWAEPEGEPRRMTRTWYAPAGEELFAVAGLWRATAEWGDAYAMVMTDSSAQMADVHDRMPVILRQQDWARWTEGTAKEAFGLVQTWPGELSVERTTDRWAGA